MAPEVGRSSPASSRSNEVFPDCVGPSSTLNEPGSRSRSIPYRWVSPLTTFLTCCSVRRIAAPSRGQLLPRGPAGRDRKSTRLNSSHGYISYAVFCLKKKKKEHSLYL